MFGFFMTHFLIYAWPEKARKSQKDRVKKMGARRLSHALMPPGRGAIHTAAWPPPVYNP